MTTGSHLLRTLLRLPAAWKLRVVMTIAVLAATVAASIVVSDRIGLSRPAGDPFLDASVASLSDQTEVVVLGSSHIFCNVRAGRFDHPTVPLAMPNAKMHHLRELLEHAVATCPNLKLAVIELSAVSVLPRADRVDEFEAEKRRQLNVALGIGAGNPWDRLLESIRRLPKLREVAQRDTLNPEWLRMQVDRESGRRIFEPGFHGWAAGESVLVGEGEHATAHAAMLDDDITAATAELAAMITLCEDAGVAIRLLRTPHYPSYAANQSAPMAAAPQGTLDATGLTADRYWDDFTMSFPRESWFDEDHLNETGANWYSDELNARVNDVLANIDKR